MLLPIIETERLFLRTYRTQDLETVYLLCTDPDVTHFFSAEFSVKREDVLASLPRRTERWRTQGFGQLGVFEKNTGKLIGYCGMQYLEDTTDVEIYYGLFKEYWQRGLATEAAKAVLRFAFESLKLPQIVAVTHPKNLSSHKVLQKLGMSRGDDAEFYSTAAAYFSLPRADYKKDSSFYELRFEEAAAANKS
ncbi:MAG: GNAT family N-acetyltransferase [Acidobacteriota bacterium]|nr:GNAT family N-acetyltransferase [Acidobacteriota bacterium]